MVHRAGALAMNLDQGVVLIKHFGRPLSSSHLHQPRLRRVRIRPLRHESEPLRYPKMVAIDAKSPPAKRTEVHHSAAGLRADTVELLEPCTNLVGAITFQKIKRQRAVSLADLLQGLLQLYCFPFEKSNRTDCLFDLCNRSISQPLPAAEVRFQMLHYFVGDLGPGARGEQGVDELLQRIPNDSLRRFAVKRKQLAMNLFEACIRKQ